MTDEQLKDAIEVAGEAVYCGFANEDSFEHLLSRAVLELASRLDKKLLKELENDRKEIN